MAHKFNLAEGRKSLSQSLEYSVRNKRSFSIAENGCRMTFDPKQLGREDYYNRLGGAQAKYLEYLDSELSESYKSLNDGLELLLDLEKKAQFSSEDEDAFAIKAVRLYYSVTFPLLHFKTFHRYVSSLISEKEKMVIGAVQRKITLRMGQRLLEKRLVGQAGNGEEKILSELVANQKKLVYLQTRMLDTYVKEVRLSKSVYHRMYPEKEN